MKMRVGVVGATGYTGEEIIRILAKHKDVEITSLSAIIEKPAKFSELFPAYRKKVDIIVKELDVGEVIKKTDLVFLALPHTVSMLFAPNFLSAKKKVIDLSADYRLEEETYKKWYKTEHKDRNNIETAVYGLPEINRSKIKKALLLANPGCYPTASILALLPAVKENVASGLIIIDAKSGATGAGRKAAISLSFGEVDENLKAYKINAHQHMPEMSYILGKYAARDIALTFTPHLIPMRRGILSTIYVPLKKSIDEEAILNAYNVFYKNEPFVRICSKGELPEIKNVVNTNYCDIGLKSEGKLLVVVSCIDNLLKGASGQAVQNMNIMCGFDESEGL